ncbi:MAG: type I-U CRISPR-associated protein Csb2 [Desulfobacterales bacterium]|jgi:CRISPR-associated protein Csb2|nr:type I-U CRISPR-associated protein Csb2 [Desulfobacterales bacterium]
MKAQLRITVRFLQGRYHGDDWPPSPVRLFQAMVAGANMGCRRLEWPKSRAALAWFEHLPSPSIVVPGTVKGFAYKSYAPNNDSDARKVVELVRQGRPLSDAMREEAMITTKHYWPRLIAEDEHTAIHYLWHLPVPMTDSDRGNAEQVCKLAHGLVALGWGIDVAIGEGRVVPESSPLPRGDYYIPTQGHGPHVLKTPGEGFLVDLERAYDAFKNRIFGKAVDTDTRPRSFRPVCYRVEGESLSRMWVSFDLMDAQGEERQSFRWEDGMLIAAWMRHAARKRFLQIEGWEQSRVDSYVCGHTAKGEENNRLSYVPLPSIGHVHSDGRYRRALVVLPFDDLNAEETPAILSRMAGDLLQAQNIDAPVAMLGGADVERDKVLPRYIGQSTEWLSVTPVILHGRDCEGKHFRPRKAEKLLLQALVESGYPADNIIEFSYQQAPFWRGPGSAKQTYVPRHLSHWPRYHVRVVFRKHVSGPVLAGIGRHYGIGVFAIPNVMQAY